MPCTKISGDDGAIIFVCTRSPISKCGCGKKAVFLCSYKLKGSKTGQTCDKKLCQKCAVVVGEDHFCFGHAKMHFASPVHTKR